MSPEQETQLFQKVIEIHTSVCGPEGQPDEGLLAKSRNHEGRITSLENWRWAIWGMIALISFAVTVYAAVKK